MVALLSVSLAGCTARSSAPAKADPAPAERAAAAASPASPPVDTASPASPPVATASPAPVLATASPAPVTDDIGSHTESERRPVAAAKAPSGAARARVAEGGGGMLGGAPDVGPVKAGEWDDNANYREFQRYLLGYTDARLHRVDVSHRQFLVVRDADGKAVPRCPVTVRDDEGHTVTLSTVASGRALLFPYAEGLRGSAVTATAGCEDGRAMARISLDRSDGVVDLKLDTRRALPQKKAIDLAFVLDTTGSMGEEIAAVKATIQKVASALARKDVTLRIGLVEYKDRVDPFTTKVYPMTTDVRRFSADVAGIAAGGGGDYPEAVNEGLHAGLTSLEWSGDAVLKLAFLVGDAPPHLDYVEDADYAQEMKSAAHRGIQVFTVAASGMDPLGQAVWRQIAEYTGGTNLFVLRGGAGPQSAGGGDPASSCGGTQTNYASGNLDALIVHKVEQQIRALDGDPLRIPGVGVDENAKPCNERVALQ
jgi:Mg-chelatase subunit ChlD